MTIEINIGFLCPQYARTQPLVFGICSRAIFADIEPGSKLLPFMGLSSPSSADASTCFTQAHRGAEGGGFKLFNSCLRLTGKLDELFGASAQERLHLFVALLVCIICFVIVELVHRARR